MSGNTSGTIPLAPPGTGMISSATPFVSPDLTPAPLSFRFLFELWKNSGDFAQRLTTLEAKMGVTDGSDAAPGQIGEYLSATNSFGGFVSGVPVDMTDLLLSAGDWDVAGSAVFTPSSDDMLGADAWLNTTSHTAQNVGRQTIYSATPGIGGTFGFTSLVVGPLRMSIAAPATQEVYLSCMTSFPTGTTVAVTAWIRARRIR